MKFDKAAYCPRVILSHPARGAWIEIKALAQRLLNARVAPRKGCVD